MRKPLRTRNLGQSDLHLANQDTSTHGEAQIHVSYALSVSLQQSILAMAPFWFGGLDTELGVVRRRSTYVIKT